MNETVNLNFGGNVDALCRLLEDDQLWLSKKGGGPNDLLLVTAAEVLDEFPGAARPHSEIADVLARDRPLPAPVKQHLACRDAGQLRDGDVLGNAEVGQDAEGLAFLGDHRDAAPVCVLRVTNLHRVPV